MNATNVAITETMEQIHKYIERYLGLHREVQSDDELLEMALRERYGDVEPGAILKRAEANSIAALRDKHGGNPEKNPFIDTHAQGDLFNSVTLRVPSMLKRDGKWTPYYECSVLEGLEYWRNRQSANDETALRFREAADTHEKLAAAAAHEAEKVEKVVQDAIAEGLDPAQVMYARA